MSTSRARMTLMIQRESKQERKNSETREKEIAQNELDWKIVCCQHGINIPYSQVLAMIDEMDTIQRNRTTTQRIESMQLQREKQYQAKQLKEQMRDREREQWMLELEQCDNERRKRESEISQKKRELTIRYNEQKKMLETQKDVMDSIDYFVETNKLKSNYDDAIQRLDHCC